MKNLVEAYQVVPNEFLGQFVSNVPVLTSSELAKGEAFVRNYSITYEAGLREMARCRIETNNVVALSVSAKIQSRIASQISLLVKPFIAKNDTLNTVFDEQTEDELQAILSSTILIDDTENTNYSQIYIEKKEVEADSHIDSIKFENLLKCSHVNLPILLGGILQFVINFTESLQEQDFIYFCSSIIFVILDLYQASKITLSNDCIPVLETLLEYPEKYTFGVSKQEVIDKIMERNPQKNIMDIQKAIQELSSIKAIEVTNTYKIILQENILFL